jgi:hypothetical protein
MTIAIKHGDWVRITPLWPGIWKVYRILAGFKEFQCSLDEPETTSNRVIVFCHRVVNDSWKRSFSHNCCEVSLIRPVSPDERKRITGLLSSDQKLRTAFEKYQSKQNRIDSITNISFGGLTEDSLRDFAGLCHQIFSHRIDNGINLREVLVALREHGLYQLMHELPRQVTLQLISINHELRGDEFVFRQFRVLNF